LNYIKILPNTQTPTPTTTIAIIEPNPIELNAYQINYQEEMIIIIKTRKKVLNKQKSILTISNENKARAKMIYYLNDDENYEGKIQPRTEQIYKFMFQNNVLH
jgi:hypothetical protein